MSDLPAFAEDREDTNAEDYRQHMRHLAGLKPDREGKTFVVHELRRLTKILEELERFSICENCAHIRVKPDSGATPFLWTCSKCQHKNHEPADMRKAIEEQYGGGTQ